MTRFMPLIAAAAGATLFAATPSLAQSTQQQQQMQQAPQSSNISDQDLRAYANATEEIQRINQEFSQQLAQADSTEQEQSIRQGAQVEMVEAIEGEGLSVQDYNQIVQAAQTDPEVASRIQEYMGTAR